MHISGVRYKIGWIYFPNRRGSNWPKTLQMLYWDIFERQNRASPKNNAFVGWTLIRIDPPQNAMLRHIKGSTYRSYGNWSRL